MGVGGMFHGALGLLGLPAVLAQAEYSYMALKVLGGLYRVWLAVALWRSAGQPIVISPATDERPRSFCRSFMLAAITQLSNPKAAIVYGSIFAAFQRNHRYGHLLLNCLQFSWLNVDDPDMIEHCK